MFAERLALSAGRVRICETKMATSPFSYRIVAELLSGSVQAGMKLAIPLNGLTSMTVGIKEVSAGDAAYLVLLLDVLDDEEAFLLEALKIRGDEIECIS